jgi:hypothetical protein
MTDLRSRSARGLSDVQIAGEGVAYALHSAYVAASLS